MGERFDWTGIDLQPANTLQVQGIGRERILLLVVPSDTDLDVAHEAMMTAAEPDNASSVSDLLITPRRAQRRSDCSAGRLRPSGISSARAKASPMTVTVTLSGGGADGYKRFGDVYVKHRDG